MGDLSVETFPCFLPIIAVDLSNSSSDNLVEGVERYSATLSAKGGKGVLSPGSALEPPLAGRLRDDA